MNEFLNHFPAREVSHTGGTRLVILSGDVMNALQTIRATHIMLRLFAQLPEDAMLIRTNGHMFGAVVSKNGGYRDAVGMLVTSKEWEAIEPVPEIEIKLEDLIDVRIPL